MLGEQLITPEFIEIWELAKIAEENYDVFTQKNYVGIKRKLELLTQIKPIKS